MAIVFTKKQSRAFFSTTHVARLLPIRDCVRVVNIFAASQRKFIALVKSNINHNTILNEVVELFMNLGENRCTEDLKFAESAIKCHNI